VRGGTAVPVVGWPRRHHAGWSLRPGPASRAGQRRAPARWL